MKIHQSELELYGELSPHGNHETFRQGVGSIERLCDGPRDAGKGITISPQCYRQTDGVFEISGIEESHQCLRHRLSAFLSELIVGTDIVDSTT